MSFYERIDKRDAKIPSRFDMTCGQADDLKRNAPGVWDMICSAFKFGYMQGVRAERAGKAVLEDGR